MNIKINQDDCIGCGVCSQICPENFKLDEDAGKAEVIGDKVAACAKEAIESCPVGCITQDS